ncbi:nicotinate-nucleotide adenylyltransferase [Chloroflexota bacterium]
MKIGVLGGTFDPIHMGHLTLAEEVGAGLKLAKILFVPAGQPWLNKTSSISTAEHRVEMVRLAIAGQPHFILSTIEIDELPSNTVDTIAELLAELSPRDELFFIMGWDNLAELPLWKEPSRLITMCRLVAVPRPGYPLPDLNALEASIPGLSQSVIVLDKPKVDISASEIRRRVAQGLSIRHLVPEAVDEYIRQYKLYLM